MASPAAYTPMLGIIKAAPYSGLAQSRSDMTHQRTTGTERMPKTLHETVSQNFIVAPE